MLLSAYNSNNLVLLSPQVPMAIHSLGYAPDTFIGNNCVRPAEPSHARVTFPFCTTAYLQGEMKLSRALHPIYFLFVAPPSAASIAWKSIAGEFDMLARSFYFIAGFLYVFFVLGNWRFLKTNTFTLAWWAYSFPCERNAETQAERKIEGAGGG